MSELKPTAIDSASIQSKLNYGDDSKLFLSRTSATIMELLVQLRSRENEGMTKSFQVAYEAQRKIDQDHAKAIANFKTQLITGLLVGVVLLAVSAVLSLSSFGSALKGSAKRLSTVLKTGWTKGRALSNRLLSRLRQPRGIQTSIKFKQLKSDSAAPAASQATGKQAASKPIRFRAKSEKEKFPRDVRSHSINTVASTVTQASSQGSGFITNNAESNKQLKEIERNVIERRVQRIRFEQERFQNDRNQTQEVFSSLARLLGNPYA